MTNDELNKRLKAAAAPERSPGHWEFFPRRVVSRLRQEGTRSLAPRRRPSFAWALGLAACVVMALAIVYMQSHGPDVPHSGQQANETPGNAPTLVSNEKLIRETLALFPNRVRAIEQDEEGIRLVLSEKPDVPESTPVWIQIDDGQRRRAVVTFSGQNLQIAKETVEVLMDAQGQVILVGDRLFWSSTEGPRAAEHLRIQARPLAIL